MKLSWLAMAIALVLVSCGETGRSFVSVPFEARGVSAETFEQGGWEVTLTRATIGFGPIGFCATQLASDEFCETAIVELAESVTIDALDPAPQPLPNLFGTTGTVRSTFFDYGITWLLTQPQHQANEGAPLGPALVRSDDANYVPRGHSGMFEGTATCVAGAATCCPDAAACPASFSFAANVDVVVLLPGDSAVKGLRIDPQEVSEGVRLTVQFDPASWWRGLNFSRLATAADASGTNTVTLQVGDVDYNALVISMTVNALPSFIWSEEP